MKKYILFFSLISPLGSFFTLHVVEQISSFCLAERARKQLNQCVPDGLPEKDGEASDDNPGHWNNDRNDGLVLSKGTRTRQLMGAFYTIPS